MTPRVSGVFRDAHVIIMISCDPHVNHFHIMVLGDMTDQASLETAMDGVDGVFAMTTFFEEGLNVEVGQGTSHGDAAKKVNVPHLVYSSVDSAHRNTGIPHFESTWKMEEHMCTLRIPATILRPTFLRIIFLRVI